MKERQYRIAKQFNIIEKVEKLESELLNINNLIEIDFDLCGFFDDMNQVIFVAKYDIANNERYFEDRKQLIKDVIKVSNDNGLTRTEDSIEDYGKSYYFVMRCNKDWK